MNPLAPAPVPIETLLAERDWVRRLARSLVADENAADDLEQETWLAVAQRPPRHGGSIRGWLATVLHRAVGRGRRDDFRRDRREAASARSEGTMNDAPTADVVAQAELHRRVVTAVLSLDEPFRTAVLLRFYDGLPPREIAARTATTAETARSRVRRGIATLRERFDAEHHGDRRAWVTALMTLAGEDTSAPSGSGPTLGHAMPVVESAAAEVVAASPWLAWAAVGAAGLAIAAVTLLVVRPWDAGRASVPGDGEASSDVASAPSVAHPPSPGALAAKASPRNDAPATGLRPARVTGRVITTDGRAVSGATVAAFGSEAAWKTDAIPIVGATVRSDDAGRYTLDGLRAREVTLVASADGLAARGLALVRVDGSNSLAVTLAESGTVERDLVVEAVAPIEGRVLDADGTPVGDAVVSADLLATSEAALVRIPAWLRIAEARSRDDGSFALTTVPGGAHVRIEAVRPDRWRARLGPVRVPDDLPSPLELRFVASRPVEISVVDDATGEPVPGADVLVRLGTLQLVGETVTRETADDGGRARLTSVPRLDLVVAASLQTGDRLAWSGAESKLGPESTSLTVRLVARAAPKPPTPMKEVRARIVGPDGKPVPAVWAAAYRWENGAGGVGLIVAHGGEGSLGSSWPPATFAEAFAAQDDDGRPLPFGAAVAEIGERHVVDLVLKPELEIRGRVADADGTSAAGVLVMARPARWAEVPPLSVYAHARARTDAAGAFRLGQLADEPYDLVIAAPINRAAPATVRVDAGARDVTLTLGRSESVVVTVLDGNKIPIVGVEAGVWRPDVPASRRRRGQTPPVASGTSDGRGRVRLERIDPDGPYVLQLSPPRDRDDLVARDVLAWVPSTTTTFDVSTSIHVRVVDAGGAAAPGARVFASEGSSLNELGAADAEGRLTWRGPSDRGAWLVASLPDVDPETLRRSGAAISARRGADVTLVLHPGVPVDVELVGGPDDVDVDVDVEAFTKDAESSWLGWTSRERATTKVRRVRLHVPTLDGPIGILAQTRDRTFAAFAELRDRSAAGRDPVRLALLPTQRISGRVVAPPGAKKVRVTLRQENGPRFEYVWPDERGDYVATGLPAGRYRVEARPDEGDRSLHAEGVVEAGGTLDLTLSE